MPPRALQLRIEAHLIALSRSIVVKLTIVGGVKNPRSVLRRGATASPFAAAHSTHVMREISNGCFRCTVHQSHRSGHLLKDVACMEYGVTG